MSKAVLLAVSAAAAVLVSGCAAIGKHTGPVEGGKRVTVGLIAVDAVSNGYPMIPVYSSFEPSK